MIKFRINFIAIFLFSLPQLWAQTADDILKYSFRQPLGTPRTLGLSGAWSTAGADISSATSNPAGIGFYRRNEIMGSAAISVINHATSFNGFGSDDRRTNLNLPNIGFVLNKTNSYKGKDAKEGIVSASFAFGLNRVNNFHQNFVLNGDVKNTSRSNAFAMDANGRDSANFFESYLDNDLAALAWRLTIIDNDGSPTSYKSRFDLLNDNNYEVNLSERTEIRGKNNEYFLSGGVNLSNLIYLGASLVISNIDFSFDKRYNEVVLKTSVPNSLNSFVVNEYYNTSGSGIGGKLGAIIRPSDYFRLGIAYHTPIRHNLTDFYQNSITVNLGGRTFVEALTPREDFFEYQLITPSRLILGGTFVYKNLFLINYDFETIDYTSGRLSSKNFGFNNQNSFARNNFNRNAFNHRVGTEINLANFKWRAGFAYSETPFNTNIYRTNKTDRMAISFGLGSIINKSVFVDFAVIHWFGNSFYTPFTGAPTATVKSSITNFATGIGYRF